MNLPLGAEYDENAPWNEKEHKPIAYCEHCGCDLFEDDDHEEINGKTYCYYHKNIENE
jgi:alkyl hydroperoxide reductase subunit AhpF